jgi:hypothetical protein
MRFRAKTGSLRRMQIRLAPKSQYVIKPLRTSGASIQ